jgi:hypothetical protein
MEFGLYSLFALFVAFYVSIIVHELGHAICARLSGFTLTSFGLGTGRPFLTLRFRQISFYLAGDHPFQGLTFVVTSWPAPPPLPTALFLAGGILANGLLALFSLYWWWFLPGGSPWGLSFALVNGFFFLVNLIPTALRVGPAELRSDAALLLSVLYHGILPQVPTLPIGMVRQFRGLWRAIRDARGLHAHLIGAAHSWVELGIPDRARELLHEAEKIPLSAPSPHLAFGLALQGLINNDATVSASQFDRAVQEFSGLGENGGVFLIRCWRAERDLLAGNAEEALGILDEVAHDPILGADPGIRGSLLAARIEAHALQNNGSTVKELWREYQALPQEKRSAADDLRTMRCLALFFARRGRKRAARLAFFRTLRTAQQVLLSLADREDQETFRRALSPFLREAQRYFRETGHSRQSHKLPRLLPSAENLEKKAERKRERPGTRLLLGILVMTVNLVLGIPLAIALWQVLPEVALMADPPGFIPGVAGLPHEHPLSMAVQYFLSPLALSLLPFLTGLVLSCFLWGSLIWKRHLSRVVLWSALFPWLVFITGSLLFTALRLWSD